MRNVYRWWSLIGLLPLVVAGLTACGEGSDQKANTQSVSQVNLANSCYAIQSRASDDYIATNAGAYRANVPVKARATAFYLKPTGIGTYLFYDRGSRLLSVNGGDVARANTADQQAEWALRKVSDNGFAITTADGKKRLAVAPDSSVLVLRQSSTDANATTFNLTPVQDCKSFPEARVNVAGQPFEGTNKDGTVSGIADIHVHLMSHYSAGGRVFVGETFDPFGLPQALEPGRKSHGDDGSLDVTGNLLRSGSLSGTHDIHGWPTFSGWPAPATLTHQQIYYVWLKRAWMGGLRLFNAMIEADDQICRIEPLKKYSCNETKTIKRKIKHLRELEKYIDAQNGGPGEGWFRIVTSPRQARKVIEKGKLAVVIGIESSNLFGCHEQMGSPQCNRADIDAGLKDFYQLGVRSLFVAHWFDNAFAGAAPESGTRAAFINIMNKLETGHYLRTGACPVPGVGEEMPPLDNFLSNVDQINGVLKSLLPEGQSIDLSSYPDYPSGRLCNVKGLTNLGRYMIDQTMARHMLIEVDHLSERAREQVLSIAEKKGYPLVSSHTGTGGAWTPNQLKRLYALGGIASVKPTSADRLVQRIVKKRLPARRNNFFFGVPLGTDTGGLASLPGAPQNSNPVKYPFKSYEGNTTFSREHTGEHTFDYNQDGVAHYGLLPDLIADMQQRRQGKKALSLLFRSAEAYLRMWQRADPSDGAGAK